MNSKTILWISGAVLIVIGLVLVRVLAVMVSDQPAAQMAMYFGGVILALGGLAALFIGMRRGK